MSVIPVKRLLLTRVPIRLFATVATWYLSHVLSNSGWTKPSLIWKWHSRSCFLIYRSKVSYYLVVKDLIYISMITLQCFQGNERLLSCFFTEDAFWRCSPSRWLRLHPSLHLTDSITLDGSPRKLCNRSWSRETESHLVNVLYHLCAAEDWHLWFS